MLKRLIYTLALTVITLGLISCGSSTRLIESWHDETYSDGGWYNWADGGSYYIWWTNGLIVVAKHHYVETLRLFLDVMVQCIITSTFFVSEFSSFG